MHAGVEIGEQCAGTCEAELARSRVFSRGVRQSMERLYQHVPQVAWNALQGRMNPLLEMRRSAFCLTPLGYSTWNVRTFEALMLGCVPVILADDTVLPFEDQIDWPAVTRRFREVSYATVHLALQRVLEEELQESQRRILRTLPRLLYTNGAPQPGDAYHGLLAELAKRKHNLLPKRDRPYFYQQVMVRAGPWAGPSTLPPHPTVSLPPHRRTRAGRRAVQTPCAVPSQAFAQQFQRGCAAAGQVLPRHLRGHANDARPPRSAGAAGRALGRRGVGRDSRGGRRGGGGAASGAEVRSRRRRDRRRRCSLIALSPRRPLRSVHATIARSGGAVHYPINVLRNLAVKGCDTEYVLIIDADFVPSKETYAELQRAAVHYVRGSRIGARRDPGRVGQSGGRTATHFAWSQRTWCRRWRCPSRCGSPASC